MKGKLSLYRILAVLFLLIAVCLSYMNWELIERGQSTNVVNSNTVLPKHVEQEKRYGYTDMLQLLAFEKDFEIKAMESNLEDKNTIKAVIVYHGDLEKFLYSLDRIKKQESLISIENIKIANGIEGAKVINLTAIFLKNK